MSLIAMIIGLDGTSEGEVGGTQLTAPVLFISSQSGSNLSMDWNDITNNSGYEIQRSTSSGFTSPTTDSVSPSSKSYTGLTDGTIYLRVRAIGNGTTFLTSNWSNVITTTISSSDIPFDLSTATHKIVRAGGTIGVDCDFTSITAAIDAITTASSSNQFVLDVKNGTYNESGEFSGAFSFYVGMTLKHYVHIIGESRAGVIINGVAATAPSNEVLVDTFHIPATCLVQSCTIHAHKAKYVFHCDFTGYEYSLYIKDCDLVHDGNDVQPPVNVGCGMHGNQNVTMINCTMNAQGFYAHGEASTTRDLAKHFEILLKNCSMPLFDWMDDLEYAANKITLTTNTITTVNLTTYTGIYDANPGNPACNTGTKVYTPFYNSGNTVTTVTRDTETASILGTTMDTPSDFV